MLQNIDSGLYCIAHLLYVSVYFYALESHAARSPTRGVAYYSNISAKMKLFAKPV